MAQQRGEGRSISGRDGGRVSALLLFVRPRQIDRLQLASGLISAVYVTLAESAWLHIIRLFTPVAVNTPMLLSGRTEREHSPKE